ncbi:MAG: zinc-ribbon domain-containing protein [Lachnospiraceae bacterium]|nr:zinc-ribbon domain-containing protein [Lachnospiraceae bacterium]
MEENRKTFCPGCGTEVPEGIRFCPECGMLLEGKELLADAVPKPEPAVFSGPFTAGMGQGIRPVGMMPDMMPEEDIPDGPDDKGLTLIVDCCRKVLATAVGDGHDEIVLYLDEKTGEYQLHRYDLPAGARKERHRGFAAGKEVFDAVTALLEETDLAQYEGRREAVITGGEYVVKFLKDGRIVRITTSNVPYEKYSLLYQVGALLSRYVDPEKELH